MCPCIYQRLVGVPRRKAMGTLNPPLTVGQVNDDTTDLQIYSRSKKNRSLMQTFREAIKHFTPLAISDSVEFLSFPSAISCDAADRARSQCPVERETAC